jgi:hypothetical protein
MSCASSSSYKKNVFLIKCLVHVSRFTVGEGCPVA